MGSGIGIAPSVMINRIVHEKGVPQGAHLTEVARLRGEIIEAQTTPPNQPGQEPPPAPVNGAEVDMLV